MNQEVLILLGVFVVGAIATLIRTILFNLAGERFVARLRKNVSLCETAKLFFLILGASPIVFIQALIHYARATKQI